MHGNQSRPITVTMAISRDVANMLGIWKCVTCHEVLLSFSCSAVVCKSYLWLKCPAFEYPFIKMVTIQCRKKSKVAAALLGLTACVLTRRRRRRLDELEEEQSKRKGKRSVWVKTGSVSVVQSMQRRFQ